MLVASGLVYRSLLRQIQDNKATGQKGTSMSDGKYFEACLLCW